ncbi:hypothetical protein C8J57DRAFT_1721544, partial [Mycena rebaudengoi]
FLAPIPKLSVIRRCTQWKSWLLIVCTGVRSIENVQGVPLRRCRYVNCFFFLLIPRSLLIFPFRSCPACISIYSTTTKSSLAHCTLSSPCLQCLLWHRCAPIHGFDATCRRRGFLHRPALSEGPNIYVSFVFPSAPSLL